MPDPVQMARRLEPWWPSDQVKRDVRRLLQLRDQDLDTKRRIEIADSRRESTTKAVRAFVKALAAPGASRLRDRAETIQDFTTVLFNMADSFAAFAAELSNGRDRLSRSRSQHCAWTLAREMACLYDLVALTAVAKTERHEGVWIRIHKAFLCARRYSLHQRDEPVSGAAPDAGLTIEQRYLSCVILGMADAYQLAAGDVPRIESFVTERIDHVQVNTRAEIDANSDVAFVVGEGIDAPVRVVDLPEISDPEALLVSTDRLVRSVQNARQRVMSNSDERVTGFGSLGGRDLGLVLAHLDRRWSTRVRRRHKRVSAQCDVEVLTTFEAIVSALVPHGESGAIGDMFGHMAAAFGGVSAENTLDPDDEALIHALSVDTSASGSRLRLQEAVADGLRVGELVVWRQTGGADAWQLGVVRWIRRLVSGLTDIGIVHVPGQPVVASIGIANTSGTTVKDETALCMVSANATQMLVAVRVSGDLGEPRTVTVNGEPVGIDTVQNALASRVLHVFKVSVLAEHRERLQRALNTSAREPVKARRGQIWSVDRAEEPELHD